jgi:hypothetical protein
MENNKKQIVIISQSHICRNPRAYKEAVALWEAGYDIVIITSIYSDDLLNEDKELLKDTDIQYQFAADLRSRTFGNFRIRLSRFLSIKLVKKLRWQLPSALGYNLPGYRLLINALNADLYFVHQELPLYLGCWLVKKGKKVIFDMEDWYSEDLLPEARHERPLKLLRRLERFALKNGAHVQTTSHVLANELAEVYDTEKPSVIYNTFNAADRTTTIYKDHKNSKTPSLYWFSQTLGPGRGVESIIEAIKTVNYPLELHLRGNCAPDYQDTLFQLMGDQGLHKLYIHPLVTNDRLDQTIKEHDIGLSLEYYQPSSRDLTATNKIFHYLVNNVPVIATPTMGHKEVAALVKGGVFLTKDFTSAALSDRLNWLLANPLEIEQAAKSLTAASEKISWNTERAKLLNTVAGII